MADNTRSVLSTVLPSVTCGVAATALCMAATFHLRSHIIPIDSLAQQLGAPRLVALRQRPPKEDINFLA